MRFLDRIKDEPTHEGCLLKDYHSHLSRGAATGTRVRHDNTGVFVTLTASHQYKGQPQDILIVEADARDGGILAGTLRFAKTFLLPV